MKQNDRTLRLSFMSLSLFLLLVLTSGIDKMYVHRKGENFSIFHIFSQEMPANKSNPNKEKLKYDFTYNDSIGIVTLAANVIVSNPSSTTGCLIETKDSTYNFPTEQLYVKAKKKKFNYRLKTDIPFDLWCKMYEENKSYMISFLFQNAMHSDTLSFSYPEKTWRNNREKILQIIQLIKLNDKKP